QCGLHAPGSRLCDLRRHPATALRPGVQRSDGEEGIQCDGARVLGEGVCRLLSGLPGGGDCASLKQGGGVPHGPPAPLDHHGKILLVKLAKGRIGEGPAALLGSLLVSHLSLAALARADRPEEERRDFYLYLDEFHTFATLSLATMLSELRKYRLSLVLAHQYLGQLEPEIRDAVFGNVGTFVSFRVGALDAPTVARELSPTFEP